MAEGVTGLFIEEPTSDAVVEAVRRFRASEFDADRIRAHAESFSEQRFIKRLRTEAQQLLDQRLPGLRVPDDSRHTATANVDTPGNLETPDTVKNAPRRRAAREPVVITSQRLSRLAWDSAAEVAALLGVDEPSTHALGSTNHVFLVSHPPLALNVATLERDSTELASRLHATALLADIGVFTRLHPGVDQPVRSSNGRLVTVWQRVEVQDVEPDWYKVGRLLRRISEVPRQQVERLQPGLRSADDLSDVTALIERLVTEGRLRQPDAAMLGRVCARLGEELAPLADPSNRVLVHGDLFGPNILTTAEGPLLCDADEVGVGPGDWDIAALLDWRRPTTAGPARLALLQGWDGDLPNRLRVRALMRTAHLRRSVKRLARQEGTPRDGYWNLVRLGAWQKVDEDWNYDGFPELHQSRPEQVFNVLGRTRRMRRQRLRTDGTAESTPLARSSTEDTAKEGLSSNDH
jgi:Ser/Thr protein kinase RdoA (MazF antagonist)